MNCCAAFVAYCGRHYRGWQSQAHAVGIQALVEKALSQVANEPIQIYCAGRTDAGVHATKQVIHFHTTAKRDSEQWIRGVNTYLPEDIRLHHAQPISTEFHARFSARSRTYCYVIHETKIRTPYLRGEILSHSYRLDVEAMNQAAQCLLGEHDFSSFRASSCQSHSRQRCVHQVKVSRCGAFIVLQVTANAFLHHMVRNIVGALLWVGEHKQPVEWLATLLAKKDRSVGAPTAKPDGLYLVNVAYDETCQLLNPEPIYPIFLNSDLLTS